VQIGQLPIGILTRHRTIWPDRRDVRFGLWDVAGSNRATSDDAKVHHPRIMLASVALL
jgi:hypothetical protein